MSMVTGKVNFSLDEETNLVVLSFNAPGKDAEEHDAMAMETKAWAESLLKRFPDRKFKVLVDLTNAGLPTTSASKIYIETLSDNHITKTAFFGVSSSIQSIITFIVNSAGRGEHSKFFIDKANALAWLNEE